MMPSSMKNALNVHLYMMHYLQNNKSTYQQAMSHMNDVFPGWFERDGDMWIVQWIEENTIQQTD